MGRKKQGLAGLAGLKISKDKPGRGRRSPARASELDQLMAAAGVRPQGRKLVEEQAIPKADPEKPELYRLELERAQVELHQLGVRLAEEQERRSRVEQRQADHAAQVSQLKGQLRELEQQLKEARQRPGLRALLSRRGVPAGRMDAALAQLPLPAIADLLHQPRQLSAWLEQHLALHCGQEQCPPPPAAVLLTVPAARCEVCEGNSLQQLLARLSETLVATGVRHLLIVGGSPAYHQVLRDRWGSSVKLSLVAGDSRRKLRQAQAEQRAADLCVIWGGTILDHKVSGLYREGKGLCPVLQVPHRGIAGMLRRLIELL